MARLERFKGHEVNIIGSDKTLKIAYIEDYTAMYKPYCVCDEVEIDSNGNYEVVVQERFERKSEARTKFVERLYEIELEKGTINNEQIDKEVEIELDL